MCCGLAIVLGGWIDTWIGIVGIGGYQLCYGKGDMLQMPEHKEQMCTVLGFFVLEGMVAYWVVTGLGKYIYK